MAPMTPHELIEAADAAVDAGNLDRAGGLYDRLVREFPTVPEAAEARRALKIIGARDRSAPPAPSPGSPEPVANGRQDRDAPERERRQDPIVMRQEPYSARTLERLRLTTWEKLDFGVTSFLYGMSVGFSFALSEDNPDGSSATTPVALGAIAYTLGAVGYLNLADPDRGDLPLALAITSYIPTTTLLVAHLAFDHPDGKNVALAVGGAGLLSVPIAIAATRNLDLDPGDTQLVRDAGFWGLALGTAGTLGFGGKTTSDQFGFSVYQSPSDKTVAGVALAGLFGGLGLGLVAASHSDVSLERVRVTTWGGYGGGLVGLLLSASSSTENTWRGIAIGSLAGLILTFASTSGLDGIPPETPTAAAAMRWSPTFLSLSGATGQPTAGFGFAGALP